MSVPLARTQRRSPRWLVPLVVTIDTLLILFPPLHWWLAQGNLSLALTYVIGVPVLIAISLLILDRAADAPSTDASVGEHA